MERWRDSSIATRDAAFRACNGGFSFRAGQSMENGGDMYPKLKIGRAPNRKVVVFSKHHFPGAKMLVSGSVYFSIPTGARLLSRSTLTVICVFQPYFVVVRLPNF